jgi:hypothetical protein
MEATLTLNQAGRQLGVDDDTLARLIRMGALPEAKQEADSDGPIWVIPERVLPSIAARNGWTIDLRGARAAVRPPAAAPSALATTDGQPGCATAPDRPAVDGAEPGAPYPDHGPGTGALVPRGTTSPEADDRPRGDGVPSVSEVVDLALLDRLLGAQEHRVVAESQVREARNALAALNQTHNRITSELEVERHERMVVTDRYREERLARAASDAKVTELRNRVTREMALAEAERQAKAEALSRSSRAERDAANALASMGWLARRRYRRLTDIAEQG